MTGLIKNSNSFAFIGDSRIAQMFNDGAYIPTNTAMTSHVKTCHWFNMANALLGQRMRIVYEQGISGYRSDQYLAPTYLNPALASGAGWLVIHGVVNDAAQAAAQGDTGATVWARILKATNQALAVGMNVILVTDPGSIFVTSGLEQGIIHQFNEYAREYAAETPGVFLFDLASVIVSLASSTTTTVVFNSGYSSDGTHLTLTGHFYAGQAFANFIGNLIPSIPVFPNSPNESPTQGNIQQQANNFFLTTTGGSLGSGVTGTLPSGLGADQQSTTATAVASVIADPNGYGNALQMVVTFAAANDKIRIYATNQAVTNYTIPGDTIDSGCYVNILAGSSNLGGVYMSTIVYPTAVNYPSDLQPYTTGGTYPNIAIGLTLRTAPLYIPTSTTAIGWELIISGTAAGSATVIISRPWLRRRLLGA